MDILKYKGYEGSAEIDMTSKVCHGKLLFIDDLVTYQAATPGELEQEFRAAVEDYIETCAMLKRAPRKPFKGTFNVRMSPELHKAATRRAYADNVSLNEVVSRAVDAYVNTQAPVNHNVTITVMPAEEPMKRVVASASEQPEWVVSTYAH